MATARRSCLPQPSVGSHPGLILSCFLADPAAGEAGGQRGDAKGQLLDSARAALRQESLHSVYSAAYRRWRSELPTSAVQNYFETKPRMLIGLGGVNVTETGLTLHHTYGVPYLPGTGLKALAARYARKIWGAADSTWLPQTSGGCFRTMFGTTDEGGLVEFLDGWLLEESLNECLLDDVMTPHHGGYYMTDEAQSIPEPTDFDEPIPVRMLSVQGKFHVAITSRQNDLPTQWLNAACDLLTAALREWGIGAKTNSGYGRMEKMNRA